MAQAGQGLDFALMRKLRLRELPKVKGPNCGEKGQGQTLGSPSSLPGMPSGQACPGPGEVPAQAMSGHDFKNRTSDLPLRPEKESQGEAGL